MAVALDIGIPPRRLGRALRRARRAAGLRRAVVAARLGVTPRLLVAWERGTVRVSRDAADALVDVYGDHLTSLVPARVPVSVELGRVAVGSKMKVLASTAHDDVLAAYVELLRAVRDATPGAAAEFRTSDLEVLAATIATDVDDVEARIVELLRCSRAEARTLHDALRRRMLLPVAGVALGAAAITGVAVDAPGRRPAPPAAGPTAPVTATTTTTSTPAVPTAPTTSPATSTTQPAAAAPPVTTSTAPPAKPASPVTTAPATAPPAPPAPVTAADAPDTDDPPVSIPEGETPTIVQP